jgi:hypothetical protein
MKETHRRPNLDSLKVIRTIGANRPYCPCLRESTCTKDVIACSMYVAHYDCTFETDDVSDGSGDVEIERGKVIRDD